MEKRFIWLAGLIAILAVGCGPAEEKTTAVTGTVTYKGQPLEGADVTFVPDTGIQAASGKTDAQGKFTLKTMGKDGAAAGPYKVAIAKYEGGGTSDIEVKEGDEKDATLKMADNPAMMEVEQKSLIPERYATPATSELTATVEDGKPNDFTFELND